MTTTYEVPSTVTITQQQVDDLLCSAFEGGITYWCGEAAIQGAWPEGATYLSDTLTRGATIALHDIEDDQVVLLTLDRFLSGIQQAAQLRGMDVARFVDDHDSETADLAVQYAVFGEVVYG